jgi:hypothetical protein
MSRRYFKSTTVGCSSFMDFELHALAQAGQME